MHAKKGTILTILASLLFAIVLGTATRFLWTGIKSPSPVRTLSAAPSVTAKKTPKLSFPGAFIENHGQVTDSSVRYIQKGQNITVYLTDDGMTFHLFDRPNTAKFHRSPKKAATITPVVESGTARNAVFKMQLLNSQTTKIEAVDKLPGQVKFVFQLISSASDGHIYAGVYVAVCNFCIGGYRGMPISFVTAFEIVYLAG